MASSPNVEGLRLKPRAVMLSLSQHPLKNF